MLRIEVEPALLRWAIERSGRPPDELEGRFAKLSEWLAGKLDPTYKQLEEFARATYTPFGSFFLEEPPRERIPISDFRTFRDQKPARPSADLLDTLRHCQERQDWARDLARSERRDPLPFAGSLTPQADHRAAARAMREVLGFRVEERKAFATWEEALRGLFRQAEEAGVLAMRSGHVAPNTHRTLSPEEFRGFALADDLAPLVFVNAADTKAAQVFTLAHELAHLWLGESALSNARLSEPSHRRIERWCNTVAAELLVPKDHLETALTRGADPLDEAQRLTGTYKVSSLVLLRRLHDIGGLDRDRYWSLFAEERKRLVGLARRTRRPGGGGGDFYATKTSQLGQRFTRQLVLSTLEGTTLYTEAFRLLGVRRMETFRKLAEHVGVPA